jgi:hypothetical protein
MSASGGRLALCLTPAVDLINHHAQPEVQTQSACCGQQYVVCRCVWRSGKLATCGRLDASHVSKCICRLSPRWLGTISFGSGFRSRRSRVSVPVSLEECATLGGIPSTQKMILPRRTVKWLQWRYTGNPVLPMLLIQVACCCRQSALHFIRPAQQR